MAKRLRQANLFETLAKKHATDEIEPSALLEELPQPLSSFTHEQAHNQLS